MLAFCEFFMDEREYVLHSLSTFFLLNFFENVVFKSSLSVNFCCKWVNELSSFESGVSTVSYQFVYVCNCRVIREERGSCKRSGPPFWKHSSSAHCLEMVSLLTSFKTYLSWHPVRRTGRALCSMEFSHLNGRNLQFVTYVPDTWLNTFTNVNM